MNRLGLIFSVFDGDQKHFDRFAAELVRLGHPFAVNFDHCSEATIKHFSDLPNFLEGYRNDRPDSHFEESHRQNALNILYQHDFDYMFQLDVDETLEKDAPAKLLQMMERNVDVQWCPLLDLWGDSKHHRIDGSYANNKREKMFWLKSPRGKCEYYHPTTHAPKIIKPRGKIIVERFQLYVIHWGIMDMADVREHTKRWDEIYTHAVGNNPYGYYPYINDPKTVPIVVDVPPGVLD